jgi:hypothetical protein
MNERLDDRNLSPQDIIDLKRILREDSRLLGQLCSWIAFDLNTHRHSDSETEEQQESLSPEDFAISTARLSARWALSLQTVINLPGADWAEEGSTPAYDIAAWLEEMNGAKEWKSGLSTEGTSVA